MFVPELPLLSLKIRFPRLFLPPMLLLLLILAWPRAFAGMFGISIPANYGTWFTGIQKLYLQSQEVIANARELYVAYLRVTNTIDALEGLSGPAKDAFKSRWRNHLRVLMEAQVWWRLDDSLNGGEPMVNEILQHLLGLRFGEDGRVTLRPEAIQTLGLALTGDPDRWADLFLNSPVPQFPSWFFTRLDYLDKVEDHLFNQETRAFKPFARELQREVQQRVFRQVLENPVVFLTCEGRETCWAPFDLGLGAGVAWDWDEMLRHMFDLSGPLHDPYPLPGELERGADLMVDGYDRYLHRRVSAAIWRAMGRELEEKLERAHRIFAKRCYDYEAAIQEVHYLARFLQDTWAALKVWDTDSGNASKFATALSLLAGGEGAKAGKQESVQTGFIRHKLEAGLARAREVKAQLKEANRVFVDLKDQIRNAKRRHRPAASGLNATYPRAVRTWTRTHAGPELETNPPPHSYLATPEPFQVLSGKIAEFLRNGS